MKLKLLSFLVLLVGMVLFIGALIERGKASSKRSIVPRSFVVHYLASYSKEDGSLVPEEYRVRAVSANGEWKETRYSFNNTVSTWGADSTGFYKINGNNKQYYGQSNSEILKMGSPSIEEIKKNPQFVKTDTIAGLTAYVMRNANGDESSYARETGATSLRQIIVAQKGSNSVIFQLEALKVEFRDVPDDEITLPNLPVKYDLVEERIRGLRNAGQSDVANSLEEAISRLKTHNQ